MRRLRSKKKQKLYSAPRPWPSNFTVRLKEISRFFAGKDEVHKTLRRAVRRLERVGISYAVAGGMAVNAHKYERTTGDVKFLVTEEGLAQFCEHFVGKQYATVPQRSRGFVDRVNGITIDFLVAGEFPGSGDPGPIAYPDPGEVSEVMHKARVLDLVTLVQLKLAARRHRDFGDVVELIRFNELDEAFAEHLHPTVRRDYVECLEEKRREDKYIAKHG